MSAALLADAMAALASLFSASPALSGVTITEGDAPSAAGDPEFIVVGHDGSLAPDGSLAEFTVSASFSTQFITGGSPPAQLETGRVNVVAVAQSGDATALAGRITRAQELLAACDAACTDVTSGTIVFDSAGSGRLVTRQASAGCAAILAFVITYSGPW